MTFAAASPLVAPAAACASTEYVAAVAVTGTDFIIVVELDDEPEIVSQDCPKAVGQAPGTRDESANVLGAHDEVSLFVTVNVYVTLSPAYAVGFEGDNETVGVDSTHGVEPYDTFTSSVDVVVLLFTVIDVFVYGSTQVPTSAGSVNADVSEVKSRRCDLYPVIASS